MDTNSITTLVIFASTLIVNATEGGDIGTVAAGIEVKINPAGWVFAIWGLIYSLLSIITFSSFLNKNIPQFILPQELKQIDLNSNWNLIFIISCIFNSSWVIFWTSGLSYAIELSFFLLLGLTVSLISLIFTDVKSTIANIAISTYAAWSFVATSLNIAFILTETFKVSQNIVTFISLTLLSTFQILWQIINKESILKKSRGILFTGLWSSIAIATNEFEPIKAIPLAATLIAIIVHLKKTKLI